MLETEKLKPVGAALVRDPQTMQILDTKGESKTLTSFWLRRIRQGDVEIVKAKSPKSTRTKKKEKK